jgi:hypothetical protein
VLNVATAGQLVGVCSSIKSGIYETCVLAVQLFVHIKSWCLILLNLYTNFYTLQKAKSVMSIKCSIPDFFYDKLAFHVIKIKLAAVRSNLKHFKLLK